MFAERERESEACEEGKEASQAEREMSAVACVSGTACEETEGERDARCLQSHLHESLAVFHEDGNRHLAWRGRWGRRDRGSEG